MIYVIYNYIVNIFLDYTKQFEFTLLKKDKDYVVVNIHHGDQNV
jgi:hypothetical protein